MAWSVVAVSGLILILIQLLMPDLVPSFIQGIVADESAKQATGVVPTLKAAQVLWVFSGIVSFLGGIVGTFVSLKRG